MWLINTEEPHRLEEFYGSNIPPYAILSHTWGNEEVTFKDFESCTKDNETPIRKRAGYNKIINTCDQSRQRGIQYVWIDTCCIDKSNSTELQEAINSMFQYYACAEVCFVHLEDYTYENNRSVDISRCRWFTRGWCLQELIAPRHLRFFDSSWTLAARKRDLINQLSSITKIDPTVFTGQRGISEFSIACRLSWAATRQTTRIEDQAYCLLGILDINMPMLYGEGAKAFQRLQREVLQAHDDPSIFEWESNSLSSHYQDMLAPSVDCFADSGDISVRGNRLSSERAIAQTSRGIRVASPNLYHKHGMRTDVINPYFLELGTLRTSTSNDSDVFRITLLKVAPGIYVRLRASCRFKARSSPSAHDPVGSETEIYVVGSKSLLDQDKIDPGINAFRIDCGGSFPDLRYASFQEVDPRGAWDSANSRFLSNWSNTDAGYIKLYSRPDMNKPPVAWLVLAVWLSWSKSACRWFLVPSDVWNSVQNYRNSDRMLQRAIEHEKSMKLSRSELNEAYQVGSLTVFVRLKENSLTIHC